MAFGEHIRDEIGRCFCKDHRREVCNECCLSFDLPNRCAEEQAGLRKPPTAVEKAAEKKAMAMFALRGMERMHPRPPEAVFESNREYLRLADAELQGFPPEEVDRAVRAAIEKETNHEIDRDALMQAWARQNPGKRHFQVGGPETQKLYDDMLSKPSANNTKRVDCFTCAYCQKSSTVKLLQCGRCCIVSYCNKKCQHAAWKAHKKECIPWKKSKDPKEHHLTWDEVKANGTAPFVGRILEVRAVLEESATPQVIQCKDRVGAIRRVAAYTDSRSIPGLKQGAILQWKNPRYHYFTDGSSGARIEEEDLKNITIL